MADRGDRLFADPDAPHGVHDLLLVAAFAAGDAMGDDRRRAAALVESCRECASLADDLRTLAKATATLPAQRRPRDFRLTATDAERLRPNGVRRFAAAFAHPALQRAHPVAAGLTMLGITGLLVSTISFGTASGPSAGGTAAAPSAAPAAAPGAAEPPRAGEPAASGGQDSTLSELASPDVGIAAQGQPAEPAPSAEPATRQDAEPTAPTPSNTPRIAIAIGSAALAALGLAVYLVARGQRRRFG